MKTLRFETLKNGETKQISINEPIKIGVFSTHPSTVKDDSSILYYQSKNFNKEETTITIVVKEKPVYISIDPFGTRSDENSVNNTVRL